jgi:hypothetical protein
MGNGGIVPRIHNHGTILRKWLASRPGRLTQIKESWYPLDRRLGGPQNRSGHCGEEKCLVMTGIEPRPSTRCLVTVLTKLSRFLL